MATNLYLSNDPMIAASQRFDHHSSEARTFIRCAANAASINNHGATRYFRRKAREAAAEARAAIAAARVREFLDKEAVVAARFADVGGAYVGDIGFGLTHRRTGEDRHLPRKAPVALHYECGCGFRCREARVIATHKCSEADTGEGR